MSRTVREWKRWLSSDRTGEETGGKGICISTFQSNPEGLHFTDSQSRSDGRDCLLKWGRTPVVIDEIREFSVGIFEGKKIAGQARKLYVDLKKRWASGENGHKNLGRRNPPRDNRQALERY